MGKVAFFVVIFYPPAKLPAFLLPSEESICGRGDVVMGYDELEVLMKYIVLLIAQDILLIAQGILLIAQGVLLIAQSILLIAQGVLLIAQGVLLIAQAILLIKSVVFKKVCQGFIW